MKWTDPNLAIISNSDENAPSSERLFRKAVISLSKLFRIILVDFNGWVISSSKVSAVSFKNTCPLTIPLPPFFLKTNENISKNLERYEK